MMMVMMMMMMMMMRMRMAVVVVVVVVVLVLVLVGGGSTRGVGGGHDDDNSELRRQEDGRGKKTAKPCVISLRIIMFEEIFCKNSPSFKQMFQSVRNQKTVMLTKDRNKTLK